MYIPKLFEIEDNAELFEFISKWGFAEIITNYNGELCANHIPFIVDKEQGKLYGHLARQNPQCAMLEKADDLLVIFSGAHCYVSPSWYVTENMVPTWNYEAVHVKGEAKLVSSDKLLAIITELSDKYESQFEQPWKIEKVAGNHLAGMVQAIVGFEIDIAEIKGKSKLSQNRSKEDKAGVISALRLQGDEMSLLIADKMEANL